MIGLSKQNYRQPAKVRHKLKDIIIIVPFATLANAEFWEEIEVLREIQQAGHYTRKAEKAHV